MSLHINVLEFVTVWKVLQHFASLQILIRTDNKATVAYINRQGGVQPVYIPGMLNMGADIMSRGGPRHRDWSLHPEDLEQVRKSGSVSLCLHWEWTR